MLIGVIDSYRDIINNAKIQRCILPHRHNEIYRIFGCDLWNVYGTISCYYNAKIVYTNKFILGCIHTERVTARHASCLNGILYKDAS
jgi:hypothetical protein